MAIQWTQDLAVDNHEIDNQHRELFDRINCLLEACNQGKGKTEVGKTITFLEEYVESHFATEEKLMLSRAYPGYAAHKAQHAQFIANFDRIKQQLATEGPSLHVILLTNHTVVDWLRSHIRKLDRSLGEFLKRLD